MKSTKKRKMVDVIVEGFLADHVAPRDGFAVSSKAAYDLFVEWIAGAVDVSFREFIAAARSAGVVVRSKGFGLLLLGQRWTPSAQTPGHSLKVYRVPAGISTQRAEEWRQQKSYKSQTELGRSLGLSSVQVGKLLVAAGLKDATTQAPVASAIAKGIAVLAKSYGPRSFYLWHHDVLPTLHRLKATAIPNPLASMESPLTPLELGGAC